MSRRAFNSLLAMFALQGAARRRIFPRKRLLPRPPHLYSAGRADILEPKSAMDLILFKRAASTRFRATRASPIRSPIRKAKFARAVQRLPLRLQQAVRPARARRGSGFRLHRPEHEQGLYITASAPRSAGQPRPMSRIICAGLRGRAPATPRADPLLSDRRPCERGLDGAAELLGAQRPRRSRKGLFQHPALRLDRRRRRRIRLHRRIGRAGSNIAITTTEPPPLIPCRFPA